MTKTLCVTFATVLAFGCSTTTIVREPRSVNPFTEKQFLHKISGEELTLEFTIGKTTDGREFGVQHDSCSWVEATSGLTRVARTKDVRKVITKGHLLGTLEGMGIGVLAGILVTVAIISGKPNPEGGNGLAGVVGISAGGVLGAVWGGIVGHSYEYEFMWNTPSPKSESDKKKQPQ